MKLTDLIDKNQSSNHHRAFTLDVVTGLSVTPKSIASKYFYDDIGSELFQKITQHKDYYPTKTEFSILQQISSILPALIHETEIDIIELGAGDGHKSKLILDGFLNHDCKVNFYPIDISEKAMHLLADNLTTSENLNIHGVIADYFNGLDHLKKNSKNKKLVLFLGSNIGNFTKRHCDDFLKNLAVSLSADDYVLIGFDLKKDALVLNKAYNDSDGLTKAFNLNLLHRINQELDANFDISKFQHYGYYNPTLEAMESYIISLADQDVFLKAADKTIHFEKFEAMHLEFSHKFAPPNLMELAKNNGFNVVQHFSDDKEFFIDALWKVQQEK